MTDQDSFENWRTNLYERSVSKFPERKPVFQTSSEIPLEPIVPPESVHPNRFAELGFPGEYPYVRGLFRGLNRQDAARYSFLLSIPIMAAAGLMAFSDLLAVPGLSSFLPLVLVGFIFAALVGYFAIRWFLAFLKSKSLLPFALYCALLSVVVLLVMGIS